MTDVTSTPLGAGLKPYSEYKDSGLPWLGRVPGHWQTAPGFAAFRKKQIKNIGLKEKRVLSLSYGRIVVKPEGLRGLMPDSFETYQIVEPGDIIIRSTDLQNDKTSLRIGMVRDRGIITSAYICMKITAAVLPEFGYQLLNTYDLCKVLYGMGSGLRQNLAWTDFKRMPVFLPSLEEQAAIVRFLDHALLRLDKAIRAKRKTIALLNEQKQAIIHHAVTRGLNPDVPLKDSGIPWLGQIPAHWDVRKIKSLASTIGGMTPNKAEERYWNGTTPWVSPKDMKVREIADAQDHITAAALRETSISVIQPGAILIVVRGMILARTFPVALTKVAVTINQDMKALRPKPELNSDYLVSLLTGIQREVLQLVEIAGHGTCCLRTDSWGAFMLPLPPIIEQEAITKFLKSELAIVDATNARFEREIELLREYRTRLIADVVTGKLDVREAVAHLPEEAPAVEMEIGVMDGADDELAESEA